MTNEMEHQSFSHFPGLANDRQNFDLSTQDRATEGEDIYLLMAYFPP